MTNFKADVVEEHKRLMDRFQDYRDKLTDVLFYGERISRSELQEGKEEVIQGLRIQIEAVQQILLPAVTTREDEDRLQAVNLLAGYQNELLNKLQDTEENIDFFANPEAPKEERNNAARETLKDLYRLDGLLTTYFILLEDRFLPVAEERLETDEKEELLEELRASSTL